MIKLPRILLLMLVCMLSAFTSSLALFRINVFRPYDINLRTHRVQDKRFQLTSWAEFGTHTTAYNRNGHKVNPLQLFQFTQNAVAMFGGLNATTQEQKVLLQKVGMLTQYEPTTDISATTEPLRGHMRFTGDLDYKAGFGLNARYMFPYNIAFAVFVPFYSMRLRNVHVQDLTSTEDFDPQDVKVRQLITDRFADVVHAFDPNLNLNGWHKTGLGDVTCMVEWWRSFPQGKPMLKNVSINGRAGLSFPSGVKTDINDLFSVPFGMDGSTAIIVGAGIELDWFNCLPFINQVRGGLDVQFWQIFGNTRERRIKTAPTQTDLFYLAKDRVHLDPGFAQEYNLYLEAHHVLGGLSLSANYLFMKQSRSTVTLFDNNFSEIVANSSKALKAWKVFELLFAATYDTDYDICKNTFLQPQFKLIYKVPVAGKRVIAFDTVTAVISLNF